MTRGLRWADTPREFIEVGSAPNQLEHTFARHRSARALRGDGRGRVDGVARLRHDGLHRGALCRKKRSTEALTFRGRSGRERQSAFVVAAGAGELRVGFHRVDEASLVAGRLVNRRSLVEQRNGVLRASVGDFDRRKLDERESQSALFGESAANLQALRQQSTGFAPLDWDGRVAAGTPRRASARGRAGGVRRDRWPGSAGDRAGGEASRAEGASDFNRTGDAALGG